jgi:hypothetical protein
MRSAIPFFISLTILKTKIRGQVNDFHVIWNRAHEFMGHPMGQSAEHQINFGIINSLDLNQVWQIKMP